MLKRLEIVGFKSFAKKTVLDFSNSTTAIVGPNGSGKSNVAEAFRFALGEQSMKSMRGKRAEDLIWGGSHSIPRANRAAVAIVLDNSRRAFKIDFDEVSIERVVFRDGASEYSINGSRVRLRDVEELLAGANIGETGHHIVSQGEADRILLSSPRERREMLEDALGLKVYEFKKQEAQRKLEKTEENISQVNSLRRELAPHLRFLEGQVKKLERAESLRKDLISAAQTYFAIEDAYLAREKSKVARDKESAQERLATASAELDIVADPQSADKETILRTEVLRKAEKEVSDLSSERATLSREIGRVEGALAEVKRRATAVAHEPYAKVPREELTALADEVDKQVGSANTVETAAAALEAIKKAVASFVSRFVSPNDSLLNEEERAVYPLEEKRKELVEKYDATSVALEKAESARARAREAMVALEETGREVRRRILDMAQAKAHEEGEVARCEAKEYEISLLDEELKRGEEEILALAGSAAISYEPLTELPEEERKEQDNRKRSLERMKIRLEEAGGMGEDIRQEHKEVSEREAFLAVELDDLAKSAASLGALINDLDTELSKHFSEGLSKVNISFSEYFALMFGGGSARLALEEPEVEDSSDESEDSEERSDELEEKKQRPGIEIAVNLPKKKVRSLMQLSGGERALTSIALIFAMSQVNPPPFLILDETDAALDEANSRRYGDMIENLAKKSQLIVITHNRETMSRTNILYGVTMGGDGVSKLLSVKFEEAVAVAK